MEMNENIQYIKEQEKENRYKDLFKENMRQYQRIMAYYKCALMEVETKFKVLDEEFSLAYDRNPIETIKTRLKSPQSIVKKLQKKGLPSNIEYAEKELNDIAGIRVICPFPEDIYFLCDCLLKQDDVKLINSKDYIKNPKSNGYRSLHLIIEIPIFLQNEKRMMKVEVQLRTIAMDFWASLEHRIRYKKNLSDETLKKLSEDLYECAEISAMLDQRMEAIKNMAEHDQENKKPL